MKLVKQNKRKIVRFTNYNYLFIFLFSLGTKLKQCFADFEVQSKKHMKEKFLADLNKIRDNKSGDDLADGLYFFYFFLCYCRDAPRVKNPGGQVVMRGAAAARQRLLICQNRVGQLPPLPLPLVHPCNIVYYTYKYSRLKKADECMGYKYWG